jgi:hypothetical protein
MNDWLRRNFGHPPPPDLVIASAAGLIAWLIVLFLKAAIG